MNPGHISNHASHTNEGVPVMISKSDNEFYHCARLYHLEKKGVCLETPFAPSPGSDVHIRMDNCQPACSGCGDCGDFRGKVEWCREHLDGYTFNYRVGVQISGSLDG